MMRFPQSLIFAQRYRIRTCSCVPIIPTDARESCLRWYCSPIYSAGVRLEGHPLESRSTEICDRHRLSNACTGNSGSPLATRNH